MPKKKKVERLSASRANTFLSCRKKYWFNYKDKKTKLANPSFKLGIACHGALEFAGRLMMDKEEYVLTKEETKKILEEYNRLAVEENIANLVLYDEGKKLVKTALGSFLSGDKVVGVEVAFGMGGDSEDLYIGDVPVSGLIDKVEEVNEDTLIIEDYKTSKMMPTNIELRNDLQLSMYDLVARKLWPGYDRYILCLNFLRGQRMFTYRTDEDREEFSAYLSAIYKSMVSLKKSDVKANVDMLCAWCDFRGDCEEYTKACDEACFFKDVDTANINDVAAEWLRIKDAKKLLEQREGELSMILMESIKVDDQNIETDDRIIYTIQRSSMVYDIQKVVNLLDKDALAKVCKIKNSALEKYVEDKPIKDAIYDSRELSLSSPFLSSRKRPNKKVK